MAIFRIFLIDLFCKVILPQQKGSVSEFYYDGILY